MLIPVFQPKLPLQILIEISRKIEEGDWNLAKLLDILRTELEARERCLKMRILLSLSKGRKTIFYRQHLPF